MSYNQHGSGAGGFPASSSLEQWDTPRQQGLYGYVQTPMGQMAAMPVMFSMPYGQGTSSGFNEAPQFARAPGGDQFVFRDAGAALANRFGELQLGNRDFAVGSSGPGIAHNEMPLFYEQQGLGMPRQMLRNQPGRGRGVGGFNSGVGVGGFPGGGRQPPQPKRRPQKGLEDNVRRTVYISYLDMQVTEEQLANFFTDCGGIVDCRICGDPNSAMRFAFIEFQELDGAQKALGKTGTVLGSAPLRVLPSKTAIVPVSKELMPRSDDEIERCSRTVYVANIDKKVDRNDVRNFFEQLCGKVSKIRLLGDYAHSTRIAFVEFIHAEGALAALNCSGALLGALPIRVSPSKTPVRPEVGNVATVRPGQASSSGAGTSGVASGAEDEGRTSAGSKVPSENATKPSEDAANPDAGWSAQDVALPATLPPALPAQPQSEDAKPQQQTHQIQLTHEQLIQFQMWQEQQRKQQEQAAAEGVGPAPETGVEVNNSA